MKKNKARIWRCAVCGKVSEKVIFNNEDKGYCEDCSLNEIEEIIHERDKMKKTNEGKIRFYLDGDSLKSRLLLDLRVLKKLKTGMWMKQLNLLTNGLYSVEVFWHQEKFTYMHPDRGLTWMKIFVSHNEAKKFFNRIKTVRLAKRKMFRWDYQEGKHEEIDNNQNL